jgi:hypothetical protein
MAKHKKNDITLGLSGGLGTEVGFRQVDGKTEAFRMPGPRKKNATSSMELHMRKFIKATYYAKGVVNDPIKKAVYQAKAVGRIQAYQLALRDFFKKPTIESIEFEAYIGVVGNKINILAVDDFKVDSVHVIIMNSNGGIVEQGFATAQPSGVDFIYTATVANPQFGDSKIIVTAKDLPGNFVTKEEFI